MEVQKFQKNDSDSPQNTRDSTNNANSPYENHNDVSDSQNYRSTMILKATSTARRPFKNPKDLKIDFFPSKKLDDQQMNYVLNRVPLSQKHIGRSKSHLKKTKRHKNTSKQGSDISLLEKWEAEYGGKDDR